LRDRHWDSFIMGLDITVKCPAPMPEWKIIAGRLSFAAPLRMIDGLPAFPDEEPAADWRELRVALPAGMVTLRRVEDGVQLVTWDNVGTDMLVQRDELAAAIAVR
jgi:hypothetical protein